MTEIVLGTNHFINCGTALAIDGQAVFTVSGAEREQLLVSMNVEAPPASRSFRVTDNIPISGQIRVDKGPAEVKIFHNQDILFSARRSGDQIDVHLDLRPVGLAIFADADSLHIGGSIFSGNTFQQVGTGINLSTK